MNNIDALDKKLLRLLQETGRLTNAELAERIGLSPSACHRRIKTLEDKGYIRNYATLLDANKMGFPISAFIAVSLNSQGKDQLQIFENAVKRIPQVMECYLVAGDIDYHLRVVVKSMGDYEQLYLDHLSTLPHVQRIQTLFAMRNVVRKTALPI